MAKTFFRPLGVLYQLDPWNRHLIVNQQTVMSLTPACENSKTMYYHDLSVTAVHHQISFSLRYTRYIPKDEENMAKRHNQMKENVTQKRQLLKRKEQLINIQEHKTMDIRLFPRMPKLTTTNENTRCSTAQQTQFSILLEKSKEQYLVHNEVKEISSRLLLLRKTDKTDQAL